MQVQHLPVLIFAQSGRFLAQSATQAGYPVWVADCFGDMDTLSIADRWQLLPSFTELTPDTIFDLFYELTLGENCQLICGSGIEQCYHLLGSLPDNIQVIGNTASAIHLIKTPEKFFDLLDRLKLSYPSTLFSPPDNRENWLTKQTQGLGGVHIQYLPARSYAGKSSKEYYQQKVSGISGSCLFLSDGRKTYISSINKQYLSPTKQHPFRLGRIESPWKISTSHQQYLKHAVEKISASVNLVGLNSLDFIISETNELLILEINPRPSASAELIFNKVALFQQHMDACLGLNQTQHETSEQHTSLFYHYATSNLSIPKNMSWPIECHDLPSAGTNIKQGEPICISIVISGENTMTDDLHLAIEQQFLEQIDKAQLEK